MRGALLAGGLLLLGMFAAPAPATADAAVAAVPLNVLRAIVEPIDAAAAYAIDAALVGFGPRVAGSAADDNAAAYIRQFFLDAGLDDATFDPFSSTQNIVGVKHGDDPARDEEVLVIGHMDSVPGSPGADDNGAGTTGLMLAAQALASFRTNLTVKFIAMGAEESGLVGSNHYADAALAAGDDILAVLNMDMIGNNPGGGSIVRSLQNAASSWITTHLQETAALLPAEVGLAVQAGSSGCNSDHCPFQQNGYHAVLIHEFEFSPYWHQPTDTLDHIDFAYLAKVARLATAAAARLAEAYPPLDLVLAPGSVRVTPDFVPTGDEVLFEADVAGVGSFGVSSVVEFRVDGAPVGRAPVLVPANGVGTAVLTFDTAGLVLGHAVEAMVDPDDARPEPSEANNLASASFTVDGPDFVFASPIAAEHAGDGLRAFRARFTVEVQNARAVPATGMRVDFHWARGGESGLIGSDTLDLGAGETATAEATWEPTRSGRVLIVAVANANGLPEWETGNNVATREFPFVLGVLVKETLPDPTRVDVRDDDADGKPRVYVWERTVYATGDLQAYEEEGGAWRDTGLVDPDDADPSV